MAITIRYIAISTRKLKQAIDNAYKRQSTRVATKQLFGQTLDCLHSCSHFYCNNFSPVELPNLVQLNFRYLLKLPTTTDKASAALLTPQVASRELLDRDTQRSLERITALGGLPAFSQRTRAVSHQDKSSVQHLSGTKVPIGFVPGFQRELRSTPFQGE